MKSETPNTDSVCLSRGLRLLQFKEKNMMQAQAGDLKSADSNNIPFDDQLAIVTHYMNLRESPFLDGSIYEKAAYACLELWTRTMGLGLSDKRESTCLQEPSALELSLFNTVSNAPFRPVRQAKFSFIDLFAGIGGFRMALQNLGGECVYSSEWDKAAQKIYFANYGEVPFGDITKESTKKFIPKAFDVLCAGFPCQPFSISGKMKGFEDTRGTLIYDVFKIIEAKQPKVVMLENVKHLMYHDHGRTLTTILRGIEHLGYKYSWKVLNASDFGVPQNRERIIIVANKSKKFDFDAIEKVSPRPIMREILDKDEGQFEYLKEPYTILDDVKQQPSGLIFVGYRNKRIRKAGVRPGTENLSRVHKQPNRIYSIDGVHPALPSQETSGRFWIYDGKRVRKLTIHECYKLMGFPQNFIISRSNTEAYRQIGNSVCIPMIQAVAKQIIKQLL